MAYSESQKKASRKYNENNYKRINMYLPPEDKEKWQEEAYMKGMNLSEFVKQCVNNSIEDDKEVDDFGKLRYWLSKYEKEHYYTCPKCKIAIKDFLIEGGSYCCTCGTTFDKFDAREAKNRYIKKLEKELEKYREIV